MMLSMVSFAVNSVLQLRTKARLLNFSLNYIHLFVCLFIYVFVYAVVCVCHSACMEMREQPRGQFSFHPVTVLRLAGLSHSATSHPVRAFIGMCR